jgi:5S rRNA maturation endonuclease (ribonuclease M5)
VNGKEYGHTDALFDKPAKGKGTSYLNKKGAWSKTHALFPFDQAIRLMNELGIKTIVLVEGPRDALRLIRAGIPAIAIFGTKSWSLMKVRLLQLAGVERIVLCMDGDPSGQDATDHILPTIEDGFEVKVIKLWVVAKKLKRDKIDPGNMPTGVLRRLEKMVLRDQR